LTPGLALGEVPVLMPVVPVPELLVPLPAPELPADAPAPAPPAPPPPPCATAAVPAAASAIAKNHVTSFIGHLPFDWMMGNERGTPWFQSAPTARGSSAMVRNECVLRWNYRA
jgi:hypothetical protein